jgi:hypothetical protein
LKINLKYRGKIIKVRKSRRSHEGIVAKVITYKEQFRLCPWTGAIS